MAEDISFRPASNVSTGSSFVEWGAVLAGGAMSAALSFTLLTFASAVGLSFISPWTDAGVSTKVIASLAIFWVLAQQIGSAIVGGYIAGRMRSRFGESSADEVEFRDGLHGGLVWAVGVVISAALALFVAGAIAKTGTEAAGRVVAATTSNSEIIAYQTDLLFRKVANGPSAPASQNSQNTNALTTEQRAEISRLVGRSVATGHLADADRTYLGNVVAERTGLPQSDAEKRVNDVFAETSRALKEAADKARVGAILTGFVTAAGLLIALGAAWWAAQRGGHHRDNAIPARFPLPRLRRYPAR